MKTLNTRLCDIAGQIHDEAPAWAELAISSILGWIGEDPSLEMRAASAQLKNVAALMQSLGDDDSARVARSLAQNVSAHADRLETEDN